VRDRILKLCTRYLTNRSESFTKFTSQKVKGRGQR